MDLDNEMDERNKNDEASCLKKHLHEERITLTKFKSKKSLKQHIKNKDEQLLNVFDRFIKAMGNLTGLLTVKKNNISEHTDRIPGTCFLQGIRKRKTADKGVQLLYATFTLTTVYHLFAENVNDRYVINKNWKALDPEVDLFYTPNKRRQTFKITEILEADKEYYVKNDWCAIECNCFDTKLIDDLEKDLVEYQSLQQQLYLMSKEPAYQDINLVIIVGHPHGGEKQVSIGHHFPEVKETLKEVRNGQRWCRYYYDAPTCPGNSGSPVFIFGQPITGFGYWFGHPHNHAKEEKSIQKIMKQFKTKPKKKPKCIGMTSIGVEMII